MIQRRHELAIPLQVDGDLELSGPSGPIRVSARRDRIVIRPTGLRACLSLLRFGYRQRKLASAWLAPALGRAGIDIEIRLGDRLLLRAGRRGVEPRWRGIGLGMLALASPLKRSRNRTES